MSRKGLGIILSTIIYITIIISLLMNMGMECIHQDGIRPYRDIMILGPIIVEVYRQINNSSSELFQEYINNLNGSLYMYHGISIIEYGIVEIGGREYFYVRLDIKGREAVYVSSLP